MPFLPWDQIDTVLLDMDGTLLDLHFDNHFWIEHLPVKIAEKTAKPIAQCRAEMLAHYQRIMGQIEWYCLDYWADYLDMDIIAAKRELVHLIKMRPDTLPLLEALRESGRDVVLVTNAHPACLSLKVEYTQLDDHIDRLISTHQFGVTKESQSLWQQLQAELQFNPQRTLFVDDSPPILAAASTFGIKYLLAVENPDSQQPARQYEDFISINDYRTIVDDIRKYPVGSR